MSYQSLTSAAAVDHRRHQAEATAARYRDLRTARSIRRSRHEVVHHGLAALASLSRRSPTTPASQGCTPLATSSVR